MHLPFVAWCRPISVISSRCIISILNFTLTGCNAVHYYPLLHLTAMPRSADLRFRPIIAALLAVSAIASLLAGGGCSSGEPKIRIEAPSAELSPVFLGVASVYLTIRNEGGRDDLLAASVSVPQALVELHDVRDRRMVKVEHIRIPSRGAVELKPGGMHLMVYNLPRDLQAGAEALLTLRFERSGEHRVPLRLVNPAGS